MRAKLNLLLFVTLVCTTVILGCKETATTSPLRTSIGPEAIPQFGAIAPPGEGKISFGTWDKIMDACPEFESVASAGVRNPMTGDPVTMNSPPHKLARFVGGGQSAGLLYLRANSGEMSFDGNGIEFKKAVAKAHEIIGGNIETYIE